MNTTITWTPEMLARFKKAHAKAKAAGNDKFIFDGHEFIVGYAGFLIEFLVGMGL